MSSVSLTNFVVVGDEPSKNGELVVVDGRLLKQLLAERLFQLSHLVQLVLRQFVQPHVEVRVGSGTKKETLSWCHKWPPPSIAAHS